MKNGRPFVAIVDDEQSVRTSLRRLIASSGMDVVTFESGQKFLDSLPVRLPDCVLLDLNMPGLSGTDVLHSLRTAAWELPVLIITGCDEPTLRTQCLAAGASACFQKPVNTAELLQAIGEAVGAHQATDTVREGTCL